MQEFPGRLEGTGICPGTTLVELDDIKEKLDWGYRFMNVGNALSYGVGVVQSNLDELRRHTTS